jgi:YggT family protein
MTGSPGYLAHWYYHVPDLILAALVWLLLARLVLDLLPGTGSDNLLVRLVVGVTDPIVRGIGFVTPRVVPSLLVIACAAAWLLAARVALFVAVSARGVRLSMGY